MSFDGIFMHRIINQLAIDLNAGKINKIYQVSKYELLFHIRANRKNVKLLISCHPNYARIGLTEENYLTPTTPSQLVMTFRKHLEGAFIRKITQLGYERIVQIDLVGRNELGDDVSYQLMIEIMGKHSNIVLCYQDGRIIDSLKRISPSMSTVRIIQPGATYQYPPLFKDKKDPTNITAEPYEKMYLDYAGLSPLLSKELVYRHTMGENIQSLLESALKDENIYISNRNGKEEYHILELKHYQGEVKVFPLYQGLESFYKEKDENDRIKQQTSDLSHFLKAELTKNQSKLNKLEQELFDSTNSDDLKLKGELLYSYLHLIEKGMNKITVENYYDNQEITITLDPRLDGKMNAKRYFQRYQKAKNAISILQEQISKTKAEIEYFETLVTQMEHAGLYDALEMKEELENLGYLKKKKKKEVQRKKQLPHFETVIAKDGTEIYIGKNNLQNDYLTFKYAKKQYYWFHVKDMPGSHVIVANENPDEYLIRLAANIAALYSKAENSSSVPINYTKIQSLKKAPGAMLGKVILNHYKTIYIDPDHAILDTLEKIERLSPFYF